MTDVKTLQVGDKVHYQPAHYGEDQFENGIVKEVPGEDNYCPEGSARVVYNCGQDWENYQNYTSALTNGRDLKRGWGNEQVFEQLGFDSMDELFKLTADADLSTPDKLVAFKEWQENDGTKRGLLNLK